MMGLDDADGWGCGGVFTARREGGYAHGLVWKDSDSEETGEGE